MRRTVTALLCSVAAIGLFAQPVAAQVPHPLKPISATAAVNTATTLTIPAPLQPFQYNYICGLTYELSNDGTATAVSNAVSTSTNFNSFAVKVSMPATASADSGVQQVLPPAPSDGCYKSDTAGTATTFVSPAGLTHAAWTWAAGYYQAP